MASSPLLPTIRPSTRVLPDLFDFHAEHNPDLPWAMYAASETTVSSITYLELVKASHRAAYSLGLQELDSTAGREVVLMLIHCDTILYVTMILGIARAGMVPFPVSPRNSPEAITNLLKKTSARHVLTQDSLSHLLSDARAAYATDGNALHVHQLPEIGTLYPRFRAHNTAVEPEWVPYPSRPTPGENDMALYMHSAGSTGLPKPIPITQRVMTQWTTHSYYTGTRKHGIRWAAMALPTFHAMGFLTFVLIGVVTGNPVAVYPPKSPPVVPNPQNILDSARLCGCNGCLVVPSIIEAWANSDEAIEFLKSLKILTYGGGPLSTENGNKLVAAGVPLHTAYGTTEIGPTAHVFQALEEDPSDPNSKRAEDWQWQGFPPTTKPRFVPQGDGTYELQFLTCETHQPSIENIPDVKGYATSDLWIPHPTKKGLWKIIGRTDDVIVLSSGEKIVPIAQERYIASHPLVGDALMFGRAKPHAGVLIDPVPESVDVSDATATSRYIDQIWPYVEQANEEAPAFARIFRDMIILTDPSRPLPRTAKGTFRRKPSLDLYADDIEKLYNTPRSESEPVDLPDAWTTDKIEGWLAALAKSLNHGKELQPTVDVFEQGFDSLNATFLRNHIVSALRASSDPDVRHAASLIDQNIVYAHPTITQLAASIASIISTKATGSRSSQQAGLIEDFIAKYAANLPTIRSTSEVPKEGIVVFLTGSTGSIGSYILAGLLADTRVAKVYAFNRPSKSATDRHLSSFEDRELPTELLSGHKYVSLEGDLNLPSFGLSDNIYKEITSSVTHIVHNAWRVDFNLGLSSFENQIAGTRKLLDICGSSSRPVRLLFTSSISVATSWPEENGLVPEAPLADPTYASDTGYSSSKYVVEQMLRKAHVNGFDVASLRVGQVCGSEASGAWNVTDWVPILVKSSLTMGNFPELDEPITWIPVDVVANTFVDMMFIPGPLPQVVNVVHPRPVPWNEVVKSLVKCLRVLPVIPLSEWVGQLEGFNQGATTEDIAGVVSSFLPPIVK
ncbi:hypothetical protein EIP86_009467 [Pleurotus ostreatoroseus]|nr:hypothetical protein EIP86_009467 [Pleurotus ostreatoroseus]